jgi:hypothetical protein
MRAQKALPESEENAAVRGISFLPAYLKYPQTAQVSSAVDTVVSLYSPCLVLSLQLLSCLPRVLFCSNYDAQCSIEDKLICLERAYEGANSAYCLRITEARILYNGCHQSLAVGLAHLHAHTHISTHTHKYIQTHIPRVLQGCRSGCGGPSSSCVDRSCFMGACCPSTPSGAY